MKRCLCLLPLAGALACAADLAGVHSVYLLPMARGMDQYLANQLASEHIFRVVTDPKLADAIITDHISEGFQAQLEGFSPTPKPPEPAKPATPEPATKAGDEAAPAKAAGADSKAKPGDEPASPGLTGKTENTLSSPSTSSGFSRARGTVFLVDAKSRQVIWSIYDPPKDFDGKEMNRTASDIVSRLKRDLNPKK
ncbi:MAG: hypothetical protein ABSE42_17080 [Bryobacteraceae bacterium]